MLHTGNQAAVDVICSASYAENYLDCIENLPGDIQRYITRVHELDVVYRNCLKDVANIKETLERDDLESGAQRKALARLEQVLIVLQEVGDQKVDLWQQVTDLIDTKSRSLDQDLRNLDYNREGDTADNPKDAKEPAQTNSSSGPSASVALNVNSSSGEKTERNGTTGSSERASKRARRSRNEVEANDSPIPETRSSLTASTSNTTNNSGNKSTSGNVSSSGGGKNSGTAVKKKKRKSRQREETPPREEEVVQDIDEPTYCLCDQISYGEMILCDNDLCPIEWFHFVCVSLTTKPKGRWFCPKCRGDRPNVMKPKSQFLKELERYNKEKEEKA